MVPNDLITFKVPTLTGLQGCPKSGESGNRQPTVFVTDGRDKESLAIRPGKRYPNLKVHIESLNSILILTKSVVISLSPGSDSISGDLNKHIRHSTSIQQTKRLYSFSSTRLEVVGMTINKVLITASLYSPGDFQALSKWENHILPWRPICCSRFSHTVFIHIPVEVYIVYITFPLNNGFRFISSGESQIRQSKVVYKASSR